MLGEDIDSDLHLYPKTTPSDPDTDSDTHPNQDSDTNTKTMSNIDFVLRCSLRVPGGKTFGSS